MQSRQRVPGAAGAEEHVAGEGSRTLDELVVCVLSSPDAQPLADQVPVVALSLNETVSWRYLARFALYEGAPRPQQPAVDERGGLSRTLVLSTPDWRRADIIVAVARTSLPLELRQLERADVEGWAVGGPRLVLVEDLRAPPPETHNALGARAQIQHFVDWAAQLPHTSALQVRDSADIIDGLQQHLAAVARARWLTRYGIDRLACRRCGHVLPSDEGVGTCPVDGTVMVYPALLSKSRVPTMVGPYPINGVIGRGAFGRIFLSLAPGRPPGALKTLVDPSDTQAVARLRRELDLLASVEHPNIVRVLEQCEVDGAPVGLLEYLSGRPLKFVIGAISPRRMVRFALELLSALDTIHRADVVHRDLKPGNIMLVDDPRRPADPPRVVLLDFGLGKHRVRNTHEDLTRGMMIGTPNYMAPELFASSAPVDVRADLYAVGVMLYQGLSMDSRYPIPPLTDSESPAEILAFMQRVQSMTPAPLTRTDVPDGIKQVVFTALARQASQRYGSAAEMSRALAAALREWNEAIPESSDRSWLTWSPPERYLSTYNWGRRSSADALTVTVSSEALPVTPPASPPSVLGSGDEVAQTPQPTDSPPHGGPADEGVRRPRWLRGLAVTAVLVLCGALVGLGVLSWSGGRPYDAQVVLEFADERGRPVEDVAVAVGGRSVTERSDDAGRLSVALPPVDGESWSIEVQAPRGLAAPASVVVMVDSLGTDGRGLTRVTLRNPYGVRNPGGARVPVTLGDGFVRLERDLRFTRLLLPDQPGLPTLLRGTELHTCAGESPVEGADVPSPASLDDFLVRCLRRRSGGVVTMRVRPPGGEVREMRFEVVTAGD